MGTTLVFSLTTTLSPSYDRTSSKHRCYAGLFAAESMRQDVRH